MYSLTRVQLIKATRKQQKQQQLKKKKKKKKQQQKTTTTTKTSYKNKSQKKHTQNTHNTNNNTKHVEIKNKICFVAITDLLNSTAQNFMQHLGNSSISMPKNRRIADLFSHPGLIRNLKSDILHARLHVSFADDRRINV